MPKVKGKEKLIMQLRVKAERTARESNVEARVSYGTTYAIPVHENLAVYHPTGQAKFLEQPFRQMLNDGTFALLIRQQMLSGKTLAQAILVAALRLQRESQLLVPVDTGALRNSAKTTLIQRNKVVS